MSVQIAAHESEINQLNQSIQYREQLYKSNLLNHEEYKQLGVDVARRYFLELDLEQLKEGK